MIGRQYELGSLLGQGKFGQVFEGTYRKHWNQGAAAPAERVAIKMEYADAPIHTLKHEATLLHYLYERDCKTTPPIYWYGLHEDLITMIIPWYEMSLHQYITSFRPSTKMIRDCVISMIDILETIHTHYIIHRDIKPQNFMIKRVRPVLSADTNGPGCIELVLIDFGLATVYMEDDKHIACQLDKTTILGSPKFTSIHIHRGIEPSRRDDIISVGYIWYLLSIGTLPWEQTNVSFANDVPTEYPNNHCLHPINQERLRRKLNITDDAMFGHFLECLYGIAFDETPDYKAIKTFVEKVAMDGPLNYVK